MTPEQVLTRDALADGAPTHKNPEELENHQLSVLASQLKELIQESAKIPDSSNAPL